ncbi:MAG: hypothetical protein OXG15_08000 [Gammaproteobacteria bacterium]|nr:hypothetical protein [Gammaproteobacteria bacterium]
MRVGVRIAMLGLISIVLPLDAQDRVLIEVLPIEIHKVSTIDGEDAIPPSPTKLNSAMQQTHEALALLGVAPTHYNLVLSDMDPIVLRCTMASGDLDDRHECESDAIDNVLDDMSDLMIRLGFVRNEPHHQGTVLLGLILLPDDFYWAHSSFGTNNWWSWVGWDPEDLHWTTTSCSVWSISWLHIVAHELGHCFGLWHLENDWNYDGDDRLDLMTSHSEGGNLTINWLKPSNVNRIQQHFRDLSSEDIESRTEQRPSAGVSSRY